MDDQARSRGSAGLSRQLARAGLGLLVVFLVTLATTLLPLRLMEPAWQLQTSANLINNGSVALLGMLLIALAAWLAPDDNRLRQRNTLVRRLALAAVVGYLLLIPLQTLALWRGINQGKQELSRQRKAAEARIEAIAKAVDTAKTPEELQSQLQGLPGAPSLPRSQMSASMPELRQNFAGALTYARSRLRAAPSEPDPARIQKLIGESLRISGSALALAFAFAAGTQIGERGPSLLDRFEESREAARRKRLMRR